MKSTVIDTVTTRLPIAAQAMPVAVPITKGFTKPSSTSSEIQVGAVVDGQVAADHGPQSLLQQAHHAPLYARDKRDAVLLFGLSHSLTLPEINDALFTAGAETLL